MPEIITDSLIQLVPLYHNIWLRVGVVIIVSDKSFNSIGKLFSREVNQLFWVVCSVLISVISCSILFISVFCMSYSASILSNHVLIEISSFCKLSIRFSVSVIRLFCVVYSVFILDILWFKLVISCWIVVIFVFCVICSASIEFNQLSWLVLVFCILNISISESVIQVFWVDCSVSIKSIQKSCEFKSD